MFENGKWGRGYDVGERSFDERHFEVNREKGHDVVQQSFGSLGGHCELERVKGMVGGRGI